MDYFFLNHRNPQSGFVDGDVTFDPPLNDYYYNGQPLSGDPAHVEVVMDKAVKRLKADFFLTTSGAFFASADLLDILLKFQGDVKTIPAKARYVNGKDTEKKFFLIHVNDKIDAFDYKNSVYAGKSLIIQRLERGEDAGKILVKGVESVAVVHGKLDGSNFFFLKNVLLIDPIVSGKLAEEIILRKINVTITSINSVK